MHPLPVRVREGSGEGALILLHGRRGNEEDLRGLLDALDPDRRLRGITVGGPLLLPPGGRHWYTIGRVGYPDPRPFADTLAQLALTLDALEIDWASTIIGGFSQETAMAYALGLGADRPSPAGIMALSGFVPTVEGWMADTERPGLPVLIAHGSQDPLIAVDFALDARDRLRAGGAEVELHETPVQHSIDPALLPPLRRWLANAAPQ